MYRPVIRLAAALLAAVVAVLLALAPASAWSTDDGAVSIHAPSTSVGSVHEVAVDGSGNIYACGYYRGNFDVDPDPANTVLVDGAGLNQPVISKYNTSGNLIWHRLLDADNSGTVADCALSSDGAYLAVTGNYKGTMDVDGSGSMATITSGADWDAFVVLINASDGSVVWVKGAGGDGVDQGTGVDFGSSNEVYVGGHFKGTADFSWGAGSADDRTSTGWEDAFLAKFAVDGSLEWSHTWGGTSNDVVHALATDGTDIYVGGYLANIAGDYDPGAGETLIGGTSGGQGGQDSWISKFNPSGELQWAKNFGANGHDKLRALAARDGFVYGTGWQNGSGGDWDTGGGTTTLAGTNHDTYTIKLNSSGVTQWVFAVGGSGTSSIPSVEAVAVDGSGNVFSLGYFRGTADLDSGSGTDNHSSTVAGKDTAFLVKHNSSGVHQWAKSFPTGNHARPYGLALDGSGNIYQSGYFQSWMDFDPSSGVAQLLSAGSSEGYVAKYTSAGELADGNSPETANPPSGFEVVEGPVDGAELQGFDAEVVLTTPLCAGGKWEMTHPTNNSAVRHYIVQDSALSASGQGIGAYIKENFTDGGSTLPHHNLQWQGSQIDHDGNTSARRDSFKNLGWTGAAFNFDVFSGEDPITFQRDADGSFKWIKTGESTWSASTVDYDGSGGSGTGWSRRAGASTWPLPPRASGTPRR